MNSEMRDLGVMLLQPLDTLNPEEICEQVRKVRDSFDPKTHTYVNANIIEDQIRALWIQGSLNSELMAFLCTNIVYDHTTVISIRRHISDFVKSNNPRTYKK